MSEIKPIRLPVRYDPKRGVIRDEMGNIVAEIPVGFGDRVTIEKRNAEVGEQIAAALNATLTEQLAEANDLLIRIQDIHCGGADDPTILEDVDALRRKITRTLNGTDTAEEIQF